MTKEKIKDTEKIKSIAESKKSKVYCDAVFPNGNETLLLSMAKKLGYTSLCFIYPMEKFDKLSKSEKETLQNSAAKINLELFFAALLTDEKKLHDSSQKFKKSQDLLIFASGEASRLSFEIKGVDLIYGVESHERVDASNYRRSGMNHILSSLAHQNKIMIAIPFPNILNSNGMQRAQLKGRVKQNIHLCKKYKVEMVLASFAASPNEMRNPSDLRSMMLLFGALDTQANFSIVSLHKRFIEKKLKLSGKILADGVEIL